MILLKAVVNEWKIQSPAITVFVTAVFCLKWIQWYHEEQSNFVFIWLSTLYIAVVELNLRIVVCRIDKQKLQMTSLKFWVKFPRRCRYMTELNYVLTWEWGHKRQTDPHNFIGIRIFAEKKGENFRYWHEFNLFYLLLAKCDFQPSYGASFACGLTVRETILLWCSRGRRAYALEVSFRNSLWRLIYIISSWNQIL